MVCHHANECCDWQELRIAAEPGYIRGTMSAVFPSDAVSA
jgi:hypothetical protein